jgi:hypothetical protein
MMRYPLLFANCHKVILHLQNMLSLELSVIEFVNVKEFYGECLCLYFRLGELYVQNISYN